MLSPQNTVESALFYRLLSLKVDTLPGFAETHQVAFWAKNLFAVVLNSTNRDFTPIKDSKLRKNFLNVKIIVNFVRNVKFYEEKYFKPLFRD